MNYNKLTSLVANVEAIETAVNIHVQGRTATTDEKEILSRYSGFGGIKEVLNIGTDNPVTVWKRRCGHGQARIKPCTARS